MKSNQPKMENDMIYVVATSTLKEGCKDEFVKLALANYKNVHAEAGCISYLLNEDCATGMPNQPALRENCVTFVECWESVEHLKAHLSQPHMKAFMEAVRPLRVSSELRILTPVK